MAGGNKQSASGESEGGSVTTALANYFGFDEHGTDLRTEIVAGVTTFLAMSYIIVVNPAILAGIPSEGKPGIVMQGYTPVEVQQMLTVVTIVSAVIGLLVMAFYANRPFGLAPGLGLNAFFALTVIGTIGVPWQTALAAVFTEGVIFILLTAVGARSYVIRLFPAPVKYAIGTGIGFYLAIIGLQAMEVVVADPATLVTLGSVASNPVALLAVFGLFVTLALYARGIRGSIVVGIVLTTVLGYLATVAGFVDPGVLFPSTLPSAQYDITPLIGAFLSGFANVDAFVFSLIVFTFFFVDFFDATGTLTGLSKKAGYLDDRGNMPRAKTTFSMDGLSSIFGSLMGTSTTGTYVESASGIQDGGRTGITSVVTGGLFVAAMFLWPLTSAIPGSATAPALILVGAMMMDGIRHIDWDDISEGVPSFLTVITMPLTFSIADGVSIGVISYCVIQLFTGDGRKVSPVLYLVAALLDVDQ